MKKPFNFAFESAAALATVVGVLIEVPVMLFAVHVVNSTVSGYEQGEGIPGYDECCTGWLPGSQPGSQPGRGS